MRQVKPEWALALANAIKEWCVEQGYPQKTMLADELQIPRPKWEPISTGGSIVGDTETYAKIFQKTGLAEADPRKIPSRMIYMPKTGGYTAKIRSWSEREWKTWLTKQPKATQQEELTFVDKPIPEVPAQITVGAIIDVLVDQLAVRIGERLTGLTSTARSSVAVSGKEVIGNGFDLGHLLEEVTAQLQRFHLTTEGERDELVHKFGQALGQLMAALDPLTQPKEEREKSIKLRRGLWS